MTAAYDPTWASAFEPMNGTYAGRGVAIFKYTGGGSKGSASDACAELVSDITRMLDNGNVAWQIGELGRLDLGGGGSRSFTRATCTWLTAPSPCSTTLSKQNKECPGRFCARRGIFALFFEKCLTFNRLYGVV